MVLSVQMSEKTLQERQCSVEGCVGAYYARWFCEKHYTRWKSHGDPNVCHFNRWDEPERLKVTLSARVAVFRDGCWRWRRLKNTAGYGVFSIQGKTYLAHRVSAALYLGFDINSKLHVLHKCDTPGCCNPAHLFIGTNDDNVADMVRKNRHAKGERNGHAKMTVETILEMRHLAAEGEGTLSLARKFNMSPAATSQIIHRQRWRHV